MTIARLLAAFALALLVFYFSVRDASSQTLPPEFAAILESLDACPPPPPRRPDPPRAIVDVFPVGNYPIRVSSGWGWSPTSRDVCVWASAETLSAVRGNSRTAFLANPPDCIPAPEPSGGLFAGLLALAGLASRRFRR